MARSTCDNDYYRFTRKGMLPVRWMSPESITVSNFFKRSLKRIQIKMLPQISESP